MPFKVGDPRPPGAGRKKGVTNKGYEAVELFARSVLEDPKYQDNVRTRARNGKLSPPIEALLYAYAYGRPTEARRVDDEEFMNDLMEVVWQHVTNDDSRQAIQAVIQEHLGGTSLRVAA